jgi:hypothetical protein
MSIEQLYLKLDNKVFQGLDTIKVELLLEAVTDWPHSVKSLHDFTKQLQVEFNSNDITYQVIEKNNPKLNPTADSWKMEVYTVLQTKL